MKDIYLIVIDGIVFYVDMPSEEEITTIKNEHTMVTISEKKGECKWR